MSVCYGWLSDWLSWLVRLLPASFSICLLYVFALLSTCLSPSIKTTGICFVDSTQVSVKMLMYNQTYKDVVQTTKSRLAAKGQRAGGQVDPQNCTSEDTLEFQQYVILQKHLQKSDKYEEIRDRSIFAFLYASVGRADEGRMIFLADMIKPRAMRCLGELPMTVCL